MTKLTPEIKSYIEENIEISNRKLVNQILSKFNVKITHAPIGRYKKKIKSKVEDAPISPSKKAYDERLKDSVELITELFPLRINNEHFRGLIKEYGEEKVKEYLKKQEELLKECIKFVSDNRLPIFIAMMRPEKELPAGVLWQKEEREAITIYDGIFSPPAPPPIFEPFEISWTDDELAELERG